MLQTSRLCLASLRYRRPYWMLFLKNVDNWKIYTVIQQPDHQRTEMLYQAWLGGLDRPYVRPKCMAHQPAWLSKKRHLLQKARLDGPETALEKYVLEWYKRFHSFQGTERPTPDDLHTAFDLVERPLDLSYACQLLHQCRNLNNIRFDEETFVVFLEACLRVDRKDCAQYALEHAEQLGFWYVDENCRRYLTGEQTWYKLSSLDNLYYPVEENTSLNAGRPSPTTATGDGTAAPVGEEESIAGEGVAAATPQDDGAQAAAAAAATAGSADTVDDEIARLQAELEALEREMGGDGSDQSGKP